MNESTRYQTFSPDLTDVYLRHLARKKANSDPALEARLLTMIQMTVPYLRDQGRLGSTQLEMARLRIQAREAGKQAEMRVNEKITSNPLYTIDQLLLQFQQSDEAWHDFFLQERTSIRTQAADWQGRVDSAAADNEMSGDLDKIGEYMAGNFYSCAFEDPLELRITCGSDVNIAAQIIGESGVDLEEVDLSRLIGMKSNGGRENALILGHAEEDYVPEHGIETRWPGIRMRVNYYQDQQPSYSRYYTPGITLTYELNTSNSIQVYTNPPLPPAE